MLTGRRILLVEDEGLLALTALMALEEAGADVVGPAATLVHGLEHARADPIDAAVLDVNLRGEISFPIADALSDRGIPFLFATGYDDPGIRARGPRVAKPYSEAELVAAVSDLLEGGRRSSPRTA